MEQFILILCVVGAGSWAWSTTGNVLLTILAVIAGGFVGSLIGFQIHETRRMREMGFSSRKELNEFDRDMRDLRNMMNSALEEDMDRRNEEAQAEGYASYSEKSSAEAAERIRAIAREAD